MNDNLDELRSMLPEGDLSNYQQVIDNSVIIIVADTSGIIRYANQKFYELSGFTPEEIINTSFDNVLSDFHGQEFRMDLWEKLKKGETWKGEIKNRKKGDGFFWQQVVVHPISKKDTSLHHFVFTGSDITRFKEAVQLKNLFLSNISHELRTPLHTIYSIGNLLSETELNSEQNDYLDNILKATGILVQMVGDLLELNKIEAGQVRLENTIFKPHELLNVLHRMYLPKADEKGLKLFLDFDPSTPEFLWGDPHRLKQIITQLLENAVKYTREGYILLKCKAGEATSGKIKIDFSVEDTGVGIASENLNMIMENLQQGGQLNLRNFGGSGLGLSLVKRLIDLQEGAFHMESAPGQGTRVMFSITYTLAEETPEEKPSAKETPVKLPKCDIKVLIAEDADINQIVLRKHMQKFGFFADFANDGKAALEKLKNESYDIVLMDMQMPVMDGYEAIKTIRSEFSEPLKNIPIISISASVVGQAYQKCLDAGADDYVSKPYDAFELKSKIEEWISKRKPVINTTTMDVNDKHKESLIDLEYLEQLSEGDDDFTISMLSYFIDNTPGVIEEMKKFYKEKEWDSLRNAAHKFKPQLTFMGIKSVFQDVENIEQFAAQRRNTDNIPQLIDKTAEVCMSAITEIKAELQKILDKNA
ncbi:MAG: PAS domain-containing hybrid sensor histidine kinase/response regulator [Bacteroidetes bacterium]|nr:MAG: PAS domain-containing hybrid sensor histidine kinase/response regulator [Bacteroidota bacterium]